MGNEIWKDVIGYEDHYKVSSFGRVFSVKSQRILCPQKGKNGYLRAHLSVEGKYKLISVHRMVAAAFIGTSELQVDHIDGTRDNNRADNLRYLTQSQNIKFGWKKKRGVTKVNLIASNIFVFYVKICIYKKVVHLGTFREEEEAYECYRKTHVEFFGYSPW